MGRKYRFDPTDKDALGFWDTSEWETKFGKMFVAFNIFFAIVGSFTLLGGGIGEARSEEHTSELQSRLHVVCRLLLEKNTKSTRMARLETGLTAAQLGCKPSRIMSVSC